MSYPRRTSTCSTRRSSARSSATSAPRSPPRGSPEEACEAIRPRFAAPARRPGLASRAESASRCRRAAWAAGSASGSSSARTTARSRSSRSSSRPARRRRSTTISPGGSSASTAATQDEEIYARRGRRTLELVERRALVPGDFYALLPPARRHPPRAHDVGGDLGLDPPAHERHRLRLAPRVRSRARASEPVSLRIRKPACEPRAQTPQVDSAAPRVVYKSLLSGVSPSRARPVVGPGRVLRLARPSSRPARGKELVDE